MHENHITSSMSILLQALVRALSFGRKRLGLPLLGNSEQLLLVRLCVGENVGCGQVGLAWWEMK